MSRVFIIQREVPHYRVGLFQRLHEHYGVKVVAAAEPPTRTGLQLAADRLGDAFVPFPMHFPDPDDAFRVTFSVTDLLGELAPDVIVSESNLRSTASWGLPKARLRGRLRRLAYWTHGWNMERGFHKPKNVALQFARLPVFATADAIATYTEEGARWVKRCLPWQQVVTLGNALDQTAIDAATAAATPRRHGEPQLLTSGRIREDKAFDRVIEVFFRVKQRLPDAALTIIGDGPARAALERQAGDELNRSIRFTGALYEETELAPHFLGADVFVLAGAAGLSVNHALAYALPIAAFPRSRQGPFHHPEIAYVVEGRSGLFVDRYDDEAMAEAIVAAHRKGSLAALRQSLRSDRVAPTTEDVVANFGKLLDLLRR